jgi:alpha-galactosidase
VLVVVLALAWAPATAGGKIATTAALSPTPPMGWSSWYRYSCGIDENLFEQTARALVSTGMAKLGYRYVDIDDCWMSKQRTATGALQPDAKKFPDGIAGVASYVHSLGLKLGIYLDAGSATCTGFPGSARHFVQDARTIASWSVDAVKVDYCRARPAHARPIYVSIQRALANTGRAIMLNICEWGYEAPWLWAQGVGSTWRTTGDYFTYGAPRSFWGAILEILDLNSGLAAYSRPGAFNDPNAMLVGTGWLTTSEERAQMSLWSMLAAPLIAGGDLTRASRATIGVLTNGSVIAVDQDRGGMQGTRVVNSPTSQVWLRKLQNGSQVILFLNTSTRSGVQSVDPGLIGIAARPSYPVEDLWSHKTWTTSKSIRVWVGGHDVRMLELPPSSSY